MNILLTLGRLAKGLELARSLHGAGHRVIIADPFRWHLSKPSRAIAKSYQVTAPNSDLEQYLQDLLEIIERDAIDLVVPVSEEALYASRLASRLPTRTRLYGPSFETMAQLHDKLAFAQKCKALGFAAPETYAADTEAARDLAARCDYVIKPMHGCSGLGVALRSRGQPLSDQDAQPDKLVQRRLYGRQISSFSMARKGKVQVTALYEGDVYLGTVSVRFKRVQTLPSVERWIAEFIAAEAYDGFISFDFFIDDQGMPFAIECNPRVTSGVHLIDRDDLAAAVTGGDVHAFRFKPKKTFQDAHSALTVAVGAITQPLTYFKLLGKVLTTKDIVFDWRDPLPFFLMTPMSWDTIRPGLFEGIPLADAATRDIVWRGPNSNISGQEEVSYYGAEPGY